MVLNRIVLALSVIALLMPAQASSQNERAESPLSVSANSTNASATFLLSGDAGTWKAAPSLPVHLNHTPPLFDTDRKDDGYRPEVSMQLVRQDTTLYLRLTWKDETVDSIPAAKTYADAGEPEVYKRQSEVIDKFRDATCVMIPRESAGDANPSLVMGDANHPVSLYYWRNGEGFVIGSAAGRGSTTMSTTAFRGHASHDGDRWHVVFELPMAGATLPIALAIWDGSKDHRDGLKYYSLWYEVTQR